jgi:HSP20 family protein
MLPIIRKRNYVPIFADHFFGKDPLSSFFSDGADYSVPAVNIRENEKAYEIEIAAPGLNKEDLKVNLEKNILTISSQRKSETGEQNDQFMRREFSFNAFCRSFSLPDNVNSDEIKATHINGILKVELPKVEADKDKKSKTIKIS